LGDLSQRPTDFAAVAAELGVSVEALLEALRFPAEGMMPPEGMPFKNMPSGNVTPRGMWPGGMPRREMPQRDTGGMRPPVGQWGFPGMPGGQQGNLLEQMGLKTNENIDNHQALLRFLEVLNEEADETFQQEIEKVLDVDQVLRYLAVSTVLVHLDNYIGMGHNYYLYEVDGKFTIIPWDLNMSFGGFSSGVDRQHVIDFYIDEPTVGPVADRPLVSRLLAVPSYLETYHGYLEELINGPFSPEVMEARIDELANMIRPYVEADTLKFYSTEAFEKGLGEDVATSTRMIGMGINIGLKAFVAQRVESINKQLKGELPSKSSDGTGNRAGQGHGWFPGN
jgi:spore coat protein H